MDNAAFLFLVLAVIGLVVPWLALKGTLKLRAEKRHLIFAAILLALTHLAWANANSTGFPRQILVQCVQAFSSALKGDQTQWNVFKSYHETDEAFVAYSEKGNVALRFLGFDATRLRDKDFIEFCYFRAVYATYPRRIYCESRPEQINTASDLLKNAFVPDEPWLEAHNVVAVVTYRVDEKGELVTDVTKR